MTDNQQVADANAEAPTTARRSTNKTLLLFLIAGAQLMVVLDSTIVNIALPSMGRYFGKSQTDMTWAINAYTLAFGGLLLLGGRAADILGRRQMFIVGLGLFSLGSLLGGLATSFEVLLAGRVVQGIGGAIAAPTALSLITTLFAEGRERNRAFAVYALAVGAVRERADRGGVDGRRLPLHPRLRAAVRPVRRPRLAVVGDRHGGPRVRLHQRREPLLEPGHHGRIAHGRCRAARRVRPVRVAFANRHHADADLRQPVPCRFLRDHADSRCGAVRHVLLPDVLHSGRDGLQFAEVGPGLPAVQRDHHRGFRDRQPATASDRPQAAAHRRLGVDGSRYVLVRAGGTPRSTRTPSTCQASCRP